MNKELLEMKIEIGESLMSSWLRHVKHCQIVQSNWKPSVTTWKLHNEELVKEIMHSVSNTVKERIC